MRLRFHSLGSQEFNSDAESHFQRCYICIILQLGISVAQVNQLSLHLHTNKNLFPFPKSPSSSYNHSLGSVFPQTTSPYCIWEITGSAAISFSVCHPSEHKRREGQDETLFLCLQKPVTDISSWPVAVPPDSLFSSHLQFFSMDSGQSTQLNQLIYYFFLSLKIMHEYNF